VVHDPAGQTGGTPPLPGWEVAQGQIHARVLVVEDNVINQKVVVRLLEKLGCRIEVAANGQEALTMLAQMAYDLVLMDCQMPEMDGFAATAAIRQREAHTEQHVPITAMTANAMQGDRERCLAVGMDDYMCKPVKAAELAALLHKRIPHALAPRAAEGIPVLSEARASSPALATET